MIKEIHIKGYRLFEHFCLYPDTGMNLLVGGNSAGKSTLLEAVMLALTGRINGYRAVDMLNPYWFNQNNVDRFFTNLAHKRAVNPFPEFQIDVYLDLPDGDLQRMRGVNNMRHQDATGLSVHAYPDPEYVQEIEDYVKQDNCPHIVPVEYYRLDWTDFADNIVIRKPKDLDVSMIDTRTIRSDRAMDYYTRQVLEERLEAKDRNNIAAEHRKMRAQLSEQVLKDINESLHEDTKSLGIPAVGVQVDQSRSTSWENTITPQIDEIPFALAGQGEQAFAKTILTLKSNAEATQAVFIEEPENHLSHTMLRKLLAHVDQSRERRQLFITTHSSYVLNRLGLDQLILMTKSEGQRFAKLTPSTIDFFKRASGFNTLRIVLAENVVLVEGPSDEIVFNRFFKDMRGKEPLECGIDIITLNGVSFERGLELAHLLGRKMAILRDNDGKKPDHWIKKFSPYLEEGVRQSFIGNPEEGYTLEPQIIKANDEKRIADILNIDETKDPESWMKANKTEAAMRIASSSETLEPPSYIADAIHFLANGIDTGV